MSFFFDLEFVFELVLVVFRFFELVEPLEELLEDFPLEELVDELLEVVVALVDLDVLEELEQESIKQMQNKTMSMTSMVGPKSLVVLPPPCAFDMLYPFSPLPLTLRSTFPP